MESVKGLKRLISVLEKLPKKLDNDVAAIIEANAQEMELDAKRNAPLVTGKLRQSIKAIKVDKLTYKIAANTTGLAPYAQFIEYGTVPHKIRPKNAKALKFKVGGETVFAKEVNHPGTKAKPFLFPAFFRSRKNVTNDLEALLKRTFNKI